MPFRCPARPIVSDEKHSPTDAPARTLSKKSGFLGNTCLSNYLSFFDRQDSGLVSIR
jgi:hypothetical protein